MMQNLEQTQVLGLAVVVAAGLAFAGGYVLGGSSEAPATPTGDVTAADTDTVEEDVLNYLETITGGQADITVDTVEKADVGELYRVDVTVSAANPQTGEDMEQQASVYTTLDGEYIFPAEPEDLQNPPQPQMQMQPQPPEGETPEQPEQ